MTGFVGQRLNQQPAQLEKARGFIASLILGETLSEFLFPEIGEGVDAFL